MATIPIQVAVSAAIIPIVARIAAGWMSSDRRRAIAMDWAVLVWRIVLTPFRSTVAGQHTLGVRVEFGILRTGNHCQWWSDEAIPTSAHIDGDRFPDHVRDRCASRNDRANVSQSSDSG
jgi:hypothetical protein